MDFCNYFQIYLALANLILDLPQSLFVFIVRLNFTLSNYNGNYYLFFSEHSWRLWLEASFLLLHFAKPVRGSSVNVFDSFLSLSHCWVTLLGLYQWILDNRRRHALMLFRVLRPKQYRQFCVTKGGKGQ